MVARTQLKSNFIRTLFYSSYQWIGTINLPLQTINEVRKQRHIICVLHCTDVSDNL